MFKARMVYRKHAKHVGLGVLVTLIVLVLINYMDQHGTKIHRMSQADPLYPGRLRLLDLPDFQYIINNNVCSKSDLNAIIIIHSHPSNKLRRNVMRKSIPTRDLEDLGMRRVFLLARAEWDDQALYAKTSQHEITKENMAHNDIIQGNFKEHYHNLTYKHIMGLQWVNEFCQQAKFIIKMDDDIIVDLYQFRDRLVYRYPNRRNIILGLLQIESKVIRDPNSKWFVSREEMARDIFPNFVSGWAYAMSIDACKKILDKVGTVKFFWIDDAFITGIVAEECDISREGLNSLYTIHKGHMKCCVEEEGYKNYVCDFYVGPSDGDVYLMESVLGHARSCFMLPCSKRPDNRRIARTCVTSGDIQHPLGTGHGEVIKVF